MDKTAKLSYCFSCRKDTVTILRRDGDIIGRLTKSNARYCKDCAKPKPWTEQEIEE